MALTSPPLLEDRPPGHEIGLVVGGPMLFGTILGVLGARSRTRREHAAAPVS